MSGYMASGWGFPPQFYNNGKNTRFVNDEEEIRQALEILFSTTPGELLNYPDYGCDLKKFMFEEITRALVLSVKEMILDAVFKFERRIRVIKIEITESVHEPHVLLINIDYNITALNRDQNIVYPLRLY